MKSLFALFTLFSTINALGAGSAGGANWRYFAAGGISAATSHGITTPVDVVKTKMQLNPSKYGTNILKATNMLVKEEGVGFLAQGLAPTVVGYGIEGKLSFITYFTFHFFRVLQILNRFYRCYIRCFSYIYIHCFIYTGAMKFGFYELFKPIFAQLTPSQFMNFLLASVVAGAVASVV